MGTEARARDRARGASAGNSGAVTIVGHAQSSAASSSKHVKAAQAAAWEVCSAIAEEVAQYSIGQRWRLYFAAVCNGAGQTIQLLYGMVMKQDQQVKERQASKGKTKAWR